MENNFEQSEASEEKKIQTDLSVFTNIPLQARLESLLLVHNRPLSLSVLAKTLFASKEDIQQVIATLQNKFNTEGSGSSLMFHDEKVQLVTAPLCADFLFAFMEEEHTGDLSKAQLETLTVIAYRGPIGRAELEQIRGVNCSVILRNLMIRGLITEKEYPDKLLPVYEVSNDFLEEIAVTATQQLPDYDRLHSDELLTALIQKAQAQEAGDDSADDILIEEETLTEILTDDTREDLDQKENSSV